MYPVIEVRAWLIGEVAQLVPQGEIHGGAGQVVYVEGEPQPAGVEDQSAGAAVGEVVGQGAAAHARADDDHIVLFRLPTGQVDRNLLKGRIDGEEFVIPMQIGGRAGGTGREVDVGVGEPEAVEDRRVFLAAD